MFFWNNIWKDVSFLSLDNQFQLQLWASFHATFMHQYQSFIWVTKCENMGFFPSIHFYDESQLNVSIWIAPTHRWYLYGHFGVWKRWGNKTEMTVECLSLSAWHGLEYHYNKGNIIILQKVIFHIITDFSNHKGIWGWSVLVSAHPLPKITLQGNLNTLASKHAI